MPSYILQPGNNVIPYPETCQALPADLPSVLAAMQPSFRKLLAIHRRRRDLEDPELVLEAFRLFLEDLSTQYPAVPQWQIYKFGPGKWPYGKWLLDKLARFITDQPKLLHALAELEREREWEREKRVQMPMEEIIGDFGAEKAKPEPRVAAPVATAARSSPPPDYSIPHPNDLPGVTAWRKKWYPGVPDKREDVSGETDAVQAHQDSGPGIPSDAGRLQ